MLGEGFKIRVMKNGDLMNFSWRMFAVDKGNLNNPFHFSHTNSIYISILFQIPVEIGTLIDVLSPQLC